MELLVFRLSLIDVQHLLLLLSLWLVVYQKWVQGTYAPISAPNLARKHFFGNVPHHKFS